MCDTLVSHQQQEKTMNTALLIKVRTLYPQSRYLQRQWIKSVRHLGDRWLVRTPQSKATLMEQAAGRMV
jgi:hypothetical protein